MRSLRFFVIVAVAASGLLAGGCSLIIDRSTAQCQTDADCAVPRDWLSFMVAEARCGTQVVLGTVLPGPGLSAALKAAWLGRHHLREGHPHIHGANFGIRADTYLTLGGWQPLSLGEDVFAIGLGYTALAHPVIALAIAVVVLALIAVFAVVIVRTVRRWFRRRRPALTGPSSG